MWLKVVFPQSLLCLTACGQHHAGRGMFLDNPMVFPLSHYGFYKWLVFKIWSAGLSVGVCLWRVDIQPKVKLYDVIGCVPIALKPQLVGAVLSVLSISHWVTYNIVCDRTSHTMWERCTNRAWQPTMHYLITLYRLVQGLFKNLNRKGFKQVFC